MIRVVIVEDDRVNALLFRTLVERRLPGEAHVTESAQDVIDRATSGLADVVLMDVALGNTFWEERPVNGVELTRLLKADPRSAHVPVILVTAHARHGDAERLVAQSGADGYASKPLTDIAAFLAQIRALASRAA